jgi:hypothetical protein
MCVRVLHKEREKQALGMMMIKELTPFGIFFFPFRKREVLIKKEDMQLPLQSEPQTTRPSLVLWPSLI